MLRIGDYNELKVNNITRAGVILDSEEGAILLPRTDSPISPETGSRLTVFIYPGSEGELLATLKTPKAKVGEFAVLEVKEVNRYGAFLDWGLPKDLFVPYSEQRFELKKGQRYIVYLYKDRVHNRIVATTRIEKHLKRDLRPPFYAGEPVNLLIYEFTGMGAKVIVENQFPGLIFQSELFQNLQVGDRANGYIHRIRDDGKLDITLRKMGQDGTEDAKQVLLEKLRENHNFLRLKDNSPAEEIKEQLQMSKNVFKKAVGGLYKARLIEITDEGILLKDDNEAVRGTEQKK